MYSLVFVKVTNMTERFRADVTFELVASDTSGNHKAWCPESLD